MCRATAAAQLREQALGRKFADARDRKVYGGECRKQMRRHLEIIDADD